MEADEVSDGISYQGGDCWIWNEIGIVFLTKVGILVVMSIGNLNASFQVMFGF